MHPTETSLVEQGLGDRSQRVRDVAQRHAPSVGLDPLAWYRERLSDTRLIALRGLGDIGSQQDAEDAVQYLGSAQASVRGAAARVVGRKGGPSHMATLAGLVLRCRGESAREAARGLIQRGITRPLAEDLAAEAIAAHSDRPVATKRVNLQLLPSADRWVALRLGLSACTHPDPDVAELGVHLVSETWSKWNRSATEPRDQIPPLRELLNSAAPLLRRSAAPLLRCSALTIANSSTSSTSSSAAPGEPKDGQLRPDPPSARRPVWRRHTDPSCARRLRHNRARVGREDVRMSSDPRTRTYVQRRTQEGLSKGEIIRVLKRYVAREVYPLLQAA